MVFNMFHESFCNTDLCLNLGYQKKHKSEREIEEEPNKKPCLLSSSSITSTSSETSLPLLFPDECDQTRKNFRINRGCQNSATQFSFTTTGNRQRGPSRLIKKEEQEGGGRKKLRLTKDQAVFLEATFKEHNSLNPKQKKDLARQLNLRLKQVEVWFQNRRARTKLKQIEEGYENLKEICETLNVENKILQKEIHELKAIKRAQPLNMQLPAATLTLCPSCQRTDPSGLIKHPSATPQRHL